MGWGYTHKNRDRRGEFYMLDSCTCLIGSLGMAVALAVALGSVSMTQPLHLRFPPRSSLLGGRYTKLVIAVRLRVDAMATLTNLPPEVVTFIFECLVSYIPGY